MDVSIIIVNYNTAKVTKNCIESIFNETLDVAFEVILVDNASTDDSKYILGRDKRIKYIQSNENIGFGKANNLGYTNAKGKYVFFLNSDTLLLSNAVKEFFDYMESCPNNIACVGTLLKTADGKGLNNSFGIFPSLYTVAKDLMNIYFTKKNSYTISKEVYFNVDYIIGADLFVRKEVIDKLGLFDPDFFMYFEESEMQYRYYKKGYLSRIYRTPQIIHFESISATRGISGYNYNQRKRFFTSMNIYMKKRYSIPIYFVYKVLAIAYLPTVLKRINTCKQNYQLLKLFL